VSQERESSIPKKGNWKSKEVASAEQSGDIFHWLLCNSVVVVVVGAQVHATVVGSFNKEFVIGTV
jgi:hypothetical protein